MFHGYSGFLTYFFVFSASKIPIRLVFQSLFYPPVQALSVALFPCCVSPTNPGSHLFGASCDQVITALGHLRPVELKGLMQAGNGCSIDFESSFIKETLTRRMNGPLLPVSLIIVGLLIWYLRPVNRGRV